MSDTPRGPNGKVIRVSSDGEEFVSARSEEQMLYTNQHEGKTWTMPFDALDPTDTDDIFGYIQNGETGFNLHVRHFRFNSTVAGYLEILRVTGTAVSGSGVTLVNENENFSADTPAGIFESGVNITGLVDGGKHEFIYLPALVTQNITIAHDIILGKNGAIALNWTSATGILTGTVKFFLHKPTEE